MSNEKTSTFIELLSALMKHPDTPADLYNDIQDNILDQKVDVKSPEYLALAFAGSEDSDSEQRGSDSAGQATGGASGERQDEDQHEPVPAEEQKPLSADLALKLVNRLISYDADEEVAALVNLVFGIAYEKEAIVRDGLATTIYHEAYTHTMDFSHAAGRFADRACQER